MAFFTGDEDDRWSFVTFNNTLIFTNGVDNVKKWPGTGEVADLGGLTGSLANTKATALASLGERVCLYGTVEGGTDYPRRVRWPIAGDPENWSGTGSGATDLDDIFGGDKIVNAQRIGGFVAIYGERVIAIQEYKNNVTDPFSFTSRVSRTGLAAPVAIVNFGDEHVFMSWDEFYSYTGGRFVEKIGKGVIEEFLRIVNPTYLNRSFLLYDERVHELLLYFPLTGSTYPDTYFRLNLKTGAWSRGTRTYTGFGYYKELTDQTWDSDSEAWDADLSRWDDRQGTNLSPLLLLGNQNGVVYKDDASTKNLAGVAITSWWDSKDFAVLDAFGGVRPNTHWAALRLWLKGDLARIDYSTDLGDTYTQLADSPLTLTGDWAQYELNFDLTSTYIRFRIYNATLSSTFDMKEIAIGYNELSRVG